MPYVLEIQIKSHETLKRTVLLLFLTRWSKATCKFSASNKSNFAREQCCVLHATKNVSRINYRTYYLLLF